MALIFLISVTIFCRRGRTLEDLTGLRYKAPHEVKSLAGLRQDWLKYKSLKVTSPMTSTKSLTPSPKTVTSFMDDPTQVDAYFLHFYDLCKKELLYFYVTICELSCFIL